MKILHKETNTLTVLTQDLDDTWLLYKTIEAGDIVSGRTTRKIKIGDAAVDRNVKVVIKQLHLSILVEKIEYEPSVHHVRLTGPIQEGTDDVPKGEYHSFLIEESTQITIKKKKWYTHQIHKLEDAQKQQSALLLVLFDREEAIIGKVTKKGYEKLTSLHAQVAKKDEPNQAGVSIYALIAKKVDQYVDRLKPATILFASAPFFQQYMQKEIQDFPWNSQSKFSTVNSVDEAGIQEVLATDARKYINDNPVALMQDILKRISTDETANYGKDQVVNAANMGAAELCLIAHEFLKKEKERDDMVDLEQVMNSIEATKGKIIIVEEDSSVHKMLMSLGGIACTLRYAL
ncbi:MAG: protein pelota [Candidatus Woesearchaeota archaeon]|jgi:protein pelota